MPEAISRSKEDYLKAVLEAECEGQTVIPSLLANWLSVSPPAVTMALKRLKRDGYVQINTDGIIHLTANGHEIAYRTALRHHLIERMLAEIFGMKWYEVHDEAERLEHAVSPEFEAKLLQKLGEKGLCPHGNSVLPESAIKRKKRGLMLLFDAKNDAFYTVAGLYERDGKLLQFLHKLGISPGSELRVLQRNYDETVAIENATGPAVLGRAAADRIWVKPVRR